MTEKKDDTVRLQKYLSDCGFASRRKVGELLETETVKVNGEVASEPGQRIRPGIDKVTVANKIAAYPDKGVLLFHKPRSVICTTNDPQGRKTLYDFITKNYRNYASAGRLDYDSSGLLILTNHGELAYRLTHPGYGLLRVYEVKVSGNFSEGNIKRLAKGIELTDGPASARCKILSRTATATWLEVVIDLGRNRIIRRMMEHVGHPVQKLHRVAHGPLKLGKMKPGEVKKLSQREYEKLCKKLFSLSKKTRP